MFKREDTYVIAGKLLVNSAKLIIRLASLFLPKDKLFPIFSSVLSARTMFYEQSIEMLNCTPIKYVMCFAMREVADAILLRIRHRKEFIQMDSNAISSISYKFQT